MVILTSVEMVDIMRTVQFLGIKLRSIRFAGMELGCDSEHDVKQNSI